MSTQQLPAINSKAFVLQMVLPLFLVLAIVASALAALVFWAATETDKVALSRQESLMAQVISQFQSNIAREQETSTFLDEAIVRTQNLELGSIDKQMGSWMQNHFSHDGAMVLNNKDEVIYLFLDLQVLDAGVRQRFADQIKPMINQLRHKLKNGDTTPSSEYEMSIGVSDIIEFNRHPSIISLKPILSDSGNIKQPPSSVFIHVAIRYLDKDLINKIRNNYLFQHLQFTRLATASKNQYSMPISPVGKDPIGYFTWTPYRPAATVLSEVAPTLWIAVLVFIAILAFLLLSLYRRSLSLNHSEAQLNYLALHDALTNLPNRTYFQHQLSTTLDAYKGQSANIILLICDLDHFQQINDALGHPLGDLLIKQFAKRLLTIVPSSGMVSRLGGDEFTVILNNMNGENSVHQICTEIIDAAQQPFDLDGHEAIVGISIGAVMAPSDGLDRDNLIRKADVALRYAKNRGRNQYARFTEAMDKTIERRNMLQEDLRKALITSNEIEVFFQPKYYVKTNTIIGAEALIRWNHEHLGWIDPEIFLPIAEQSNLSITIGNKVLQECCALAVRHPHIFVSLNVSASEIRNPEFASRVISSLKRKDLTPSRLEIELAEDMFTEFSSEVEKNILKLHMHGVRFALDHFGSSMSSIALLQQYPFTHIKIKQDLVQTLNNSESNKNLIMAIIDIARSRSLAITAVGVETTEHLNTLTEIGCNYMQGFIFSHPMPADKFDRLMVNTGLSDTHQLGPT